MDDQQTQTAPGGRPGSPCVNICTLDEVDTCTGCLRTLDEIAAWSSLPAGEQRRIVDELPGRARARARHAGV